MKSGLYLSENKDSTDSPQGLYLSKDKMSNTQNNAVRLGGALYSKDPRENYKGLDVPAGHSALFRAMDGQDRFYAEIMRKQQEEKQASLKQALNQAAQKAMTELNMVKNNHLTVFNSKVKDEISIKILDPFVFELLKKNPIADLSHYSLNVLKHIRESYKLKDSINIENIIKDNLGYLLTDYREVYNNISDPFKAVISDLFKAGSQIEINSIKDAFLQDSNHLNDYFEYPVDNNNQSPITEIICKESLLKVIEDIGLKLENLNKAKSEQNDQEYLSRIASSNEEEKEPHEDDSVDNSFHFSQNPSVRSEPILSDFEIVPMTELEKALAKIKELEVENFKLKQKVNNPIQNNDDENILRAISEAEAREKAKDEIIQKVTEESLTKDRVIGEQARTINVQDKDLEHSHQIKEMQAKEIHELRQDKIELREQVKEHKDLAQEWKFMVKEKNESGQKLLDDLTAKDVKIVQLEQQLAQLHLPHSLNQSHGSWQNIDQENIIIPEILGDINVDQH